MNKFISNSTLIIFILIVVIYYNSNGQTNGYLQLLPKYESSKPHENNLPYTNDHIIDSIFTTFRVTKYFSSFKNFKSPELQNVYTIYSSGSPDSLKAALEATEKFLEVYKIEYPQLSCLNPITYNDPVVQDSIAGNWGFELVDAQCAWTVTKGDSNILVAMVDTEFDTTHEDLLGKIAYVSDFYPNEPIVIGIHGTKTSGIVTARTNNNKGIASIGNFTKVGGYRVSNSASVFQKIQDAYNDRIRIINVSWTNTGFEYPQGLLAIKEMTDKGMILVLAAGNSSTQTDHYYIANVPGVILVSGVDSGNVHGISNTAQHDRVDLCSPSHKILTTIPGGYKITYGGTSISAPFVSATAALILSLNPCLTPPEVEEIIKSSTDTIADGANFPNQLGTGRLNAYKAVSMVKDYKHEITTNTTWTGINRYGADIIIDSGIVLTIHDTLLMGCNNHLIVKRGGKLILDNAYLSTLPYVDGFWPGIIVEGKSSDLQTAATQGTVIIKNNSIIEHALIGVNNF